MAKRPEDETSRGRTGKVAKSPDTSIPVMLKCDTMLLPVVVINASKPLF